MNPGKICEPTNFFGSWHNLQTLILILTNKLLVLLVQLLFRDCFLKHTCNKIIKEYFTI